MPPRYHFSANERIAPIWVIPELGHALTSSALGEDSSFGVSHLFHQLQTHFLIFRDIESWLGQRTTCHACDVCCSRSLFAPRQALLHLRLALRD